MYCGGNACSGGTNVVVLVELSKVWVFQFRVKLRFMVVMVVGGLVFFVGDDGKVWVIDLVIVDFKWIYLIDGLIL